MAIGDETLPERGPNLLEQIVQACLEKLAAQASSPRVASLQEEALACQKEIDAWRTTRPSDEERSAMRTRLLGLNARIAAL